MYAIKGTVKMMNINNGEVADVYLLEVGLEPAWSWMSATLFNTPESALDYLNSNNIDAIFDIKNYLVLGMEIIDLGSGAECYKISKGYVKNKTQFIITI